MQRASTGLAPVGAIGGQRSRKGQTQNNCKQQSWRRQATDAMMFESHDQKTLAKSAKSAKDARRGIADPASQDHRKPVMGLVEGVHGTIIHHDLSITDVNAERRMPSTTERPGVSANSEFRSDLTVKEPGSSTNLPSFTSIRIVNSELLLEASCPLGGGDRLEDSGTAVTGWNPLTNMTSSGDATVINLGPVDLLGTSRAFRAAK